jgi:serine/threonine protein kinase
MPKTLTPVTIITLLKKAKKDYQKTSPDPKEETEQRHRKVDEDLKILRRFARKEETGADLEKVFEARKLQCAKKMKVQYQKLKTGKDKDPNKAQLPKYLKALGKLTLAVKRLTYKTLNDVEEALNPEALEEEDLAELDVAEKEEETPTPNDQVVAGATNRAGELLRRLNALTADFKAAVAAKAPAVPRMQQLFSAIPKSLKQQNYDQAAAALDELEALVRDAAGAALIRRLNALAPGVSAAMAARAPTVPRMQQLVQVIRLAVQKKEYGPAGTALDELEGLVQGGAPKAPPPPPDLGAAFKARLKTLLPLVLAAQQANPARAAELALGVNEAKTLAGKQDFINANSRLNAVEKLLKGNAPAPLPSGAEVLERFKRLGGPLKARLALGGQDRSAIQTLATTAAALLKNKDYTQASKVIGELETTLQRQPEAEPEDATSLLPEVHERWRQVFVKLLEEIQADPALKSAFLPECHAIMKLMNAGSLEAPKRIDALRGMLARLRTGEGLSPVYVKFEQLRAEVHVKLQNLMTYLPAKVATPLQARFDAAARQDKLEDDDKSRAAIQALTALDAELKQRAVEFQGDHTRALRIRLAKTLQGPDGQMLDPAVRAGFAARLKPPDVEQGVPVKEQLQDLLELEKEVSGALADRKHLMASLVTALERVEPLLKRVLALTESVGKPVVGAALKRDYEMLTNSARDAVTTIALEDRKKRVRALELQLTTIIKADFKNFVKRQEASLPLPAASLAQGDFLGEGKFGTVYKLAGPENAATTLVGKTFDANNPIQKVAMNNEATIYAVAGDHPNIAKCYGIQQIGGQSMLVMEQIKGGDVNSACDKLETKLRQGKIGRPEYLAGIQHMLKGTLKGLAHFQSLNLVHNDIKGDNIRFNAETGEAVLIDMGQATISGRHAAYNFLSTMPPEGFVAPTKEQKAPTTLWDSFAVGKLLFPLLEQMPDSPEKYTFVTGTQSARPAELRDGIIDAKFDRREFQPGEDLHDLLTRHARKALKADKDGMTAVKNPDNTYVGEALKPVKARGPVKPGEYAALTDYVDFMNRLTHPDPAQRLTPQQALNHPFMSQALTDDLDLTSVFASEPPPEPEPEPEEEIVAEQNVDDANRPDNSQQRFDDADGAGDAQAQAPLRGPQDDDRYVKTPVAQPRPDDAEEAEVQQPQVPLAVPRQDDDPYVKTPVAQPRPADAEKAEDAAPQSPLRAPPEDDGRYVKTPAAQQDLEDAEEVEDAQPQSPSRPPPEDDGRYVKTPAAQQDLDDAKEADDAQPQNPLRDGAKDDGRYTKSPDSAERSDEEDEDDDTGNRSDEEDDAYDSEEDDDSGENTDVEDEDEDAPPPREASVVVLRQSHLAWESARKKAHAGIRALKVAIVKQCHRDPRIRQIVPALSKLDKVLKTFDESLGDKLDEALNAPAGEERQALQGEALGLIRKYRAYVERQPLVKEMDHNGFVSLNVKKLLTTTLTVLGSKLGA